VTKVQGVVAPDPESDEKAEQQSQDNIMVTIALSAHDAERWIWFAEGESANYAQMWLTLENEQTDNSGTTPVDGSNAWQ
jgi:pilus assembly protein CpaB